MNAAVIVHQRTGREVGRFASYQAAAEYRRDYLRPSLAPTAVCPFAVRDLGRPLAVGDLFLIPAETVQPCPRCGVGAVDLAGGRHHLVVDPNGARTAWQDCKPADVASEPTLF